MSNTHKQQRLFNPEEFKITSAYARFIEEQEALGLMKRVKKSGEGRLQQDAVRNARPARG